MTFIFIHSNAQQTVFSSFTVIEHNENCVVHWSTSTELGNGGFEIEKALDSKLWERIGSVNG
jgi:hypothetical protein